MEVNTEKRESVIYWYKIGKQVKWITREVGDPWAGSRCQWARWCLHVITYLTMIRLHYKVAGEHMGREPLHAVLTLEDHFHLLFFSYMNLLYIIVIQMYTGHGIIYFKSFMYSGWGCT